MTYVGIVIFALSSVSAGTYPIRGRVGPVRPQVPPDPGGWLPTVKKSDRTGPDIQRTKDGRLKYLHPSFSATVRRDGTVRFSDKHLGLNWPRKKGPPSPHPGYVAEVLPDGRVPFNPRFLSNDSGQGGGSFDLFSLIQRARGKIINPQDKLRFLDRTRPWRLSMRQRFKLRVQKAYLETVDRNLLRIWRTAGLTYSQKRKVLFLLWDEFLESDDDRTGRLARRGREMIEEFIRRHLPPESQFAYTRGELLSFNRQRESRSRFDPYGAEKPAIR